MENKMTSEELYTIISRYNRGVAAILPLLQDIVKRCGCIPVRFVGDIARGLGVTQERIYTIADFYGFPMEGKGKYLVKVCHGGACFDHGARAIMDVLRDTFGKDPSFILETGTCMGACGDGPNMTVNGKLYTNLTPEKAVQIVAQSAGSPVAAMSST